MIPRGLAPSRYRLLLAHEAAEAGLDFRLALNGCKRKGYPEARWRVWRALYDTGRYSLPGIGAACNRHHTTVMYGIRKIKAKSVDNFLAAE